MKLSDLGEFGLIRRFAPQFQAGDGATIGIGDDCAVIPRDGEQVDLVTTDLLLENRHFLAGRILPEDLGYKSLAVNLSDIAAMGGVPTAAFLSVGFPAETDVRWVDRFFEGIKHLTNATQCPLLGGDTTRSASGLVINFTVLGTAKKDQVKYRSTARSGDVLAVTGFLGDSGAGLRLLLNGKSIDDEHSRHLVAAHHRPHPHLAQGQWLAQQEAVHAMMDVSDGIDSDIRHILEQSHVGAVVDLATLPLSDALQAVCAQRGWNASSIAATGGEDYVLLCTVDAERFEELAERYQAEFEHPLYAIGRITDTESIQYELNGQPAPLPGQGFDHFA